MYTTKDAFMKAYKIVGKVTENQSLEALLLCEKVLNLDKTDILVKIPTITNEQFKEIISLAKKRAKGYPLQYLMEEWEFYGRSFEVGEGVLIPRADTETLIEAVLAQAKKMASPFDILDLCSGTGCIAITLGKELENSSIYALEKDEKAIEYLNKNIKKHDSKVSVINADALNYRTNKQFDIIVSNPPYLTKADMEKLQKEVKHEPKQALFGGDDGLQFYREITSHWGKCLKKGGLLAFEVGAGQADDVAKIMENDENANIRSESVCKVADLCGIMRVVYGTHK